jgi:hypothetical protein
MCQQYKMCIYSNANSQCQFAEKAQGNCLRFGVDCAFAVFFSSTCFVGLSAC